MGPENGIANTYFKLSLDIFIFQRKPNGFYLSLLVSKEINESGSETDWEAYFERYFVGWRDRNNLIDLIKQGDRPPNNLEDVEEAVRNGTRITIKPLFNMCPMIDVSVEV